MPSAFRCQLFQADVKVHVNTSIIIVEGLKADSRRAWNWVITDVLTPEVYTRTQP